MYSYATNHNLEALVEVHTIRELERAQINPKIIGVNNRDLKRFETDVLHTNKLLKFKSLIAATFQRVAFIQKKMLRK